MVTERNKIIWGDGSKLKSQIQNLPTKQKHTWLNFFCTSAHTAVATTKKTVERTSWALKSSIHTVTTCCHFALSMCKFEWLRAKNPIFQWQIQLFQRYTWIYITLGCHMNSGLQLFYVRKCIWIIFSKMCWKTALLSVCQNKSSAVA